MANERTSLLRYINNYDRKNIYSNGPGSNQSLRLWKTTNFRLIPKGTEAVADCRYAGCRHAGCRGACQYASTLGAYPVKTFYGCNLGISVIS